MESKRTEVKIGAHYSKGNGCEFSVWAPRAKSMSLRIVGPSRQKVALTRDDRGYWKAVVSGIKPGARYLYELSDGAMRPDPASFFQPQGVHKASCVIDHADFCWRDRAWRNIPLKDYIIYELHAGTFSSEGTFEAITKKLRYLKRLGINAIELMPVAQFPGERNWGYDGAYPFAVQNSYGGPQGLKKLVDACHRNSIAVILDVVYNHLGPEGNYSGQFAPYFTDKYKTPWGSAVNFDDAYSAGVRNYFVQNALYWFEYYHIDALRLDAVHGIFDMSAKHILWELAEHTEEFCAKKGSKHYLIAESDLNDTRLVRTKAQGGYGLSAQWCDDFHHALHALLTGEDEGYYKDFGSPGDLHKAITSGFVYDGNYSCFRKRFHGSSSIAIPASQFVVFSQNHDQIGNRLFGERLSSLVSFEYLKLSAGMVMTAPYIPLLFMGEEYGEEAPFLYFIHHSDSALIDAVREGRKNEFKDFKWEKIPPDPQSKETFARCKLGWSKLSGKRQRAMFNFYRALIALRTKTPALAHLSKNNLRIHQLGNERVVVIYRSHAASRAMVIVNVSAQDVQCPVNIPGGRWQKRIDSGDTCWLGKGSALPKALSGKAVLHMRSGAFAVYLKGS
ncbi:MAG: malto-oligosyltrehalose trehalohydrolase [Candidatus Omnitrophota bacterium]|nr:malto-oligosyltrehalose trehalohydrolase [Candidatus Omnitrophota bacterium]